MGYNAFALIYRPGAQTTCEDLSRVIAYIFEHADELQVDTDGYSLWGGLAGGRMADWVGTYGTENFGEKAYPHLAAVIIPANVKHWHGAAKDSWFQHIAQEIPGENVGTEWCEPIDDEQYNKLK